MSDSPSVFRASANGVYWQPDRCYGPASGWGTHIGRAVRGDPDHPIPHPGDAVTVLDQAGREIDADLAQDVVPDDRALVTPRWLFVYGTLMAGEGLHEHLGQRLEKRRDRRGTRRASVAGRLHDFDTWPGLVPDPSGRDQVLAVTPSGVARKDLTPPKEA